jgi:hypothetical protein
MPNKIYSVFRMRKMKGNVGNSEDRVAPSLKVSHMMRNPLSPIKNSSTFSKLCYH